MEQRRMTKEERRRSLEEASRDPIFLAELEELERDFQFADAEAARMIDELDEARPEEEPL